ncbi:universal stress protein [Natronobeatus ordinarius]|uniref:universal stress protein n=1 Tax=Natronobeatus ordinarius TaxID=2963433 RepID=UPI0020CF9CE5|nr:universal stress protein [Natronobeatus ordinarius]
MAIVAAVDRSDRASTVIAEAAELAVAFGEPVHVVHVMTRSEFADRNLANVEESGKPVEMDRIREFARDVAAEAAEELEVPFEAVGLLGKPAERLVEYADEHDARYVVIAPRKRSRTGKALFGSVAQSIILNSDRPVVTATQ